MDADERGCSSRASRLIRHLFIVNAILLLLVGCLLYQNWEKRQQIRRLISMNESLMEKTESLTNLIERAMPQLSQAQPRPR